MSKAALNMETKILQNAYPELRLYAIHPGWMKTPQGYAGATKDCTPQQEPSDTAEKLLTLAETKNIRICTAISREIQCPGKKHDHRIRHYQTRTLPARGERPRFFATSRRCNDDPPA